MTSVQSESIPSDQYLPDETRSHEWLVVILVFVALGAYLRFSGLGLKSLWLDEFSTWHVSQLDLKESLVWGPELTKPPLYQLVLRAVTNEPHASEWMLRFPAALVGVFVIVASAWLAYLAGGWRVACSLSSLMACNELQIEYSQQARSYTMLMLGSTLSTALWYAAITRNKPRLLIAYTVTIVLSFHAHYLTVLTGLAHVVWWVAYCICSDKKLSDKLFDERPRGLKPAAPLDSQMETKKRSIRNPLITLAAIALLCLPQSIHYLRHQTSIFQGLDWITPATMTNTFEVLGTLTFGSAWSMVILPASLIVWLGGTRLLGVMQRANPSHEVAVGSGDIFRLLLIHLLCAWLGLLVISWLSHPAMIARYALPAAIPAMLLPLVICQRIDRRLPLVLAGVFVLGFAPQYLTRLGRVEPGFRELSGFLAEHVDPENEAIVLAIDGRGDDSWQDMERLAHRYYPLDGFPMHILPVPGTRPIHQSKILDDPRALYVIVFRADPLPMIQKTGRRLTTITIDNQRFDQLLFSPYRVYRVAPINE